MLKIMSSKSIRYARYQTREIRPEVFGESGVFDRQGRIPEFNQPMLSEASLMLIGAGGINGEIGEGSARKGVGQVIVVDGDSVELSNLNRQRFYREDLYRNKALCLAKNLSREAPGSTQIEAYGYNFEDFLTLGEKAQVDVVVCGVDNDETRYFISRYFINKAPVVFIAVDETADHGYVFIQGKEGRPCFLCLYPRSLANGGRKRCTPAGAVKDILKVVAGVALYAIDSLLMERKRDWNYRHISLAGFTPDIGKQVEPHSDCPVCGQK